MYFSNIWVKYFVFFRIDATKSVLDDTVIMKDDHKVIGERRINGEAMEECLLVKKAKRGDIDAFAELYSRIYKKLYQFAFCTLKNHKVYNISVLSFCFGQLL